MLHNARVTVFIIFELLRENQQAGVKLPPTQIRVNNYNLLLCWVVPKNKNLFLFIFNLFNVDNLTTILIFGNETSFPRKVTTTSNL